MNISKKSLGVMQGRLSPIVNNKIQCFPFKHWTREFKKLRSLNINKMEWTIEYPLFYKNPLMGTRGQKKINELKKKYKIEINSITCDSLMQKPFWKAKKYKTRINLINDFKNLINFSSLLKIKYIVVPLVDNGFIKNKVQKDNIIKTLKNLIPIINKKKVIILFEFENNPKFISAFLKKLDPKIFGVNYDTGNSAAKKFSMDEEFNEYGRYIKNIHLKDKNEKSTSVPLGEGLVDFENFFYLLKKYNYKNNLIFQTARSKKGTHVNEIKKNIGFIKKFFV
tara:strand:+ start:1176 stop:2015 length:840 start_codon:yes stop_codon:yes gene_type:complete